MCNAYKVDFTASKIRFVTKTFRKAGMSAEMPRRAAFTVNGDSKYCHTHTHRTLDQLHSVFARWGIPHQVVSDNGPPFVSQEFEQFMSLNNIKQLTSSPYHHLQTPSRAFCTNAEISIKAKPNHPLTPHLNLTPPI